MTRIVNSLVGREVPKILGSSTAFIVLVVALIVIVIVSFSAVIYLFRREKRERKVGDQEAQRRRRYNAQPLVDRDLSNPQHSRKWYSSLWGSRDRHNHIPLDKSTTTMGRSEQDWIQENSREWDVDDSVPMQSSDNQSGLLRMSEKGSSASYIVEPRSYPHRMDSATSDGASSVHYDPHAVRGLPYPERFPIFPQATISSTLSSPTSSSPSSPVPRRILKSPEPMLNTPSHDNAQDAPPQFASRSGTKFF